MLTSRCLSCGYRGGFIVEDRRTRVLTILNGELIEGIAGALIAECPRCEFAFPVNPTAHIEPDKVIYNHPDIIEFWQHGYHFKLEKGSTFACLECGTTFTYGHTRCEDLCSHLKNREPLEWVFLGLVVPVDVIPWKARAD
jgi:hypothetical protein